MRTLPLLLLTLAMLGGVFAYQQAAKPPQYTGPPPVVASPPPAAAPAPAAAAMPPPEAELKEIADAFEQDQESRTEAQLRALQAKHPESAELQALLARLEYAQAISGRSQPIDKSRLNFDGPLMRSAEQWAIRATETNPDLAEAWRMRGRVALALGDPRQSLAYLERAEALQPDSALIRLHKGDTLQAMQPIPATTCTCHKPCWSTHAPSNRRWTAALNTSPCAR